MDYLMLGGGIALLVLGGDYLVRAAVALSLKLNISKAIVGLTIVSFATSAPELIVSLKAALEEHSDISLGNVIGSNIANIGLVLAVTTIIFPIGVGKQFFRLHWPVMILMSLIFVFFMFTEVNVNRLEGGILFFCLVVFLYLLMRFRKHEEQIEEVDEALRNISGVKTFIWLSISGVALYFGSDLLVRGAVNIATALGVSEKIIAVSVIAVGTSLPELSASVLAAVKQEKAISLGNLIGSNIFNVGAVIGITGLIHPIEVSSHEILSSDAWWMLAFGFVILPLVLIYKDRHIHRGGGFFILLTYFLYIILNFT